MKFILFETWVPLHIIVVIPILYPLCDNLLIFVSLVFELQWLGMGNQELLDYFSSYAAVKARHSYGPNGHRGMSVLVFEATAVGYLEAERLHKHFAEQCTDRDAWERPRRNLFSAGGKRQLYGYLASKEDMDVFNHHCQGMPCFQII